MECDAIIIGAGLAGLSAANEIASRSRASIVVIERRFAGSNNPTPMIFADVPVRFGLEDYTIGAYDRFTFHSPLGNKSTHVFERIQLVALDYRPACLSLLDRASTAGNVWVYAAAARSLVRHGVKWLVSLNDGRQLSAPLVIDASGRGLFTSRVLGLARPRSYSHCYGVRLSNCQIPNPQEAFFFAPCDDFGNGGGWLYPLQQIGTHPKEPGQSEIRQAFSQQTASDSFQASFGYASLSQTPVLPGATIKQKFKRALAEFEPYANWMKDAIWDHVEVGTIPIYPLRRFVYDGLLIAGDAAGQATIWSCLGSEAALEAGRLAGDAALTALKRGDFSARTLGQYQKHWDQRHRRIYQHNAWIAPTVWSMSERDWNRQIPRVQELTSEQMLARLRINWPVPTLPQAAFVRAYDLAGRARRAAVRQVRSMWSSRAGFLTPTAKQ